MRRGVHDEGGWPPGLLLTLQRAQCVPPAAPRRADNRKPDGGAE